MTRRVLLAGLVHETHTFLREVTPWESFEVALGDRILAKAGDQSPMDGFLEVAKSEGWTVVPTIDIRAFPSGTVEDAVFERFWREFEARARPELAAGLDAVFLVLHGAMATQSLEDPEGEFLERLRALPGAGRLPVFAVFDLHGNISARMCALASGLVAYRRNPHTDAKEAAARATALLARCLREGSMPRTHWCRVPIIWAPPGTGTQTDPMLALESLADRIEAADPQIWAYNIAAGYSFADTRDTGVSLSVVSPASASGVRAHLEAGARLAWDLRELGNVRYPAVDPVVRKLDRSPSGPIILVEPADNIGGGAPGDGTGILRALLQHDLGPSLVVINDPDSVSRLASTPIGGGARLAIGGKGWELDPGPVDAEATLVSRSNGAFTLENKRSHLASMKGIHQEMGPCAVVRIRGTTVLLTSLKTPPFDLGQLRSQGIEPRDFAVIGVKAAVAHRAAYDPIASASFFVDTPGPCSSDVSSFRFRRLRRPVFPLDPIANPVLEFS